MKKGKNQKSTTERIEKGIWYQEPNQQYIVNLGSRKIYSFPTLEYARKFRDETWAERYRLKKEDAFAKLRKAERKEIYEEKPYPFNAMEDAGIDCDPKVFAQCVDKAGEGLERHKKAFLAYYDEGRTLADIGKDYGVTRERVRQMAARMLRTAASYAESSRQKDRGDAYVEERRNLIECRNALVEEFKKTGKWTEGMTAAFGEPTLKTKEERGLESEIDCLGLSVRSVHCLKRAGVTNLADLTRMSREEVISIRNLGNRSYREIAEKLKEFNLSFADGFGEELE